MRVIRIMEEAGGSNKELVIDFINQIEGWKTRIKNLHWAAPKRNIHKYLDELLDIVSDYEDTLAETSMGILGQLDPLDITGRELTCDNAWDLIDTILEETLRFYDELPERTAFVGITSETETFIHNLQKYKYLFSLCDFE